VYPPVLTEHGLEAALQSAADRSPLPVTVDLGPLGRHSPAVEAALYFCTVEALQNAAKHSQASKITLAAGRDDSTLWISVADDGVGFDGRAPAWGSGLLSLDDRLGAIGGRVDVAAARGRGTTVRASVPV
jgi:signal transduction histidine kinase